MFFIIVEGNLSEEEDDEELDPDGFAEESESDDESYVDVIPAKKAASSRPSLGGNRSSSRKTRSSTSTTRTGASLDTRSDVRTNNGNVMLPYVTFPYETFTKQGRKVMQVIKIHSLSGCVDFDLGYNTRVAEGNSEILIEFHKNNSCVEFYRQGNRYLNPNSPMYCSELQHEHDYAMATATRNFTEYPQQTMRVPSLNYPIRDILYDEIRPCIYQFRDKNGKKIYAENSVLYIYVELEVPEYKRDRAATMSLVVSDSFDDTPSYYPKTDPSPPKSPRGGDRIKHFSSSGGKGNRRAKKRHAPPSVASIADSLSSMSVDEVDKKVAAQVQVPSTVFNHNSRAQVAASRQTSTVPDQAVLQQQQQMLNEQALQEQQIQFNRQAEMMALQQQQLQQQQQQQQIMRQRQYEEQMAAERARLESLARYAEQRRNEVSNREDVRRLLAETETRLADHAVQQQQVTDTDEEDEDSDLLSYFNGESL